MQLVVRPSNYAPDYAPFTVNDEGILAKVEVSIRVRVD